MRRGPEAAEAQRLFIVLRELGATGRGCGSCEDDENCARGDGRKAVLDDHPSEEVVGEGQGQHTDRGGQGEPRGRRLGEASSVAHNVEGHEGQEACEKYHSREHWIGARGAEVDVAAEHPLDERAAKGACDGEAQDCPDRGPEAFPCASRESRGRC